MEYPTTRWTMLAQATLHGDSVAGRALADFCKSYRSPIIATLRARGILESRVEDMAHDFLLRLMNGSSLRQADPAKGRFRCYLSAALRCFLADDVDYNHAQKRGGGIAPMSLDAASEQSGILAFEEENLTPAFDREWALHILGKTLEAIQVEWDHSRKSERFEVLRDYLPGGVAPSKQGEVAVKLGISETALRSEISRLRARFRELLRSQVAATVGTPAEVDDEMRYLHAALRHPGVLIGEEKKSPQIPAESE